MSKKWSGRNRARSLAERLGGMYIRRRQNFWDFWPPLPLHLHFMYCSSAKLANFLTPSPPHCRRLMYIVPKTINKQSGKLRRCRTHVGGNQAWNTPCSAVVVCVCSNRDCILGCQCWHFDHAAWNRLLNVMENVWLQKEKEERICFSRFSIFVFIREERQRANDLSQSFSLLRTAPLYRPFISRDIRSSKHDSLFTCGSRSTRGNCLIWSDLIWPTSFFY